MPPLGKLLRVVLSCLVVKLRSLCLPGDNSLKCSTESDSFLLQNREKTPWGLVRNTLAVPLFGEKLALPVLPGLLSPLG